MKGINLIVTVFLTGAIFVSYEAKIKKEKTSKENIVVQSEVMKNNIEYEEPHSPNITLQTPTHLSYSKIIEQLRTWEKEAPDLVEVGFYGKTKKDTNICYIRIFNKKGKKNLPRVLITGCIHGDEPWSTGCVMAYAGNLLGKYEENKDLIKSRDIYIVPVVSPDSYPTSRYVDGVDPNRDFPVPSRPNHISTISIKNIQNFFHEIRPNAVISGHTFGRVFLIPFGDTVQKCPNESDYQRIIGKMSDLCNYTIKHTHDNYRKPIHGTEVDWYYRNGALSVVMEFGTHQKIPKNQEIESELARTWNGFLHFLQEAPIVDITNTAEEFDFSGNYGVDMNYFKIQNALSNAKSN